MRSLKSALLFVLLAWGGAGCMAAFYKSVATSAVAVSTSYTLLSKEDHDRQTFIRAEEVTDKVKGRADFEAWKATYDKARKAIEATDDLTKGALAAAPQIDGVVANKTQINKWLALLASAYSTLTQALADAGVTLPKVP